MPHHPATEIICPNCGHKARCNYCEQCGQALHLHRDTFRGIIVHFIAHYFHYESRLWGTLKTLITRPGKLAVAYRAKIRQRYIPPVSLYIVISLFFFILFSFTVKFAQVSDFKTNADGQRMVTMHYYLALGRSGFREIEEAEEKHNRWDELLQYIDRNELKGNISDLKTANDERKHFFEQLPVQDMKFSLLNGEYILYNYFILPYMYRNMILTWDEGMSVTVEKFIHVVPKIFFLLMPLFAALLFLGFFKKKKNLFFVDHAVMSLHIHSFLYISVGIQLILGSIFPLHHLMEASIFWVFLPLVYLIIACRRFYQRSWAYTIFASTFIWGIYLLLVLLVALSAWLLVIHWG